MSCALFAALVLASGCLNTFERDVIDPSCPDCRWISIGASPQSTHVIDRDGRMFSWGQNTSGVLGVPAVTETSTVPVRVEGDCWKLVRGGGDSNTQACAIDCSGALFCWGENGNGEAGVGEPPGTVPVPTRVGTERDWIAVAAGKAVTCGVRRGGTLWCWGWEAYSALGHNVAGGESNTRTPSRVPVEVGVGPLDVGHKHSCALDDDGGLWCWGGTDQGGTLPPVRAQSSARWRSVATGEDHTCAIRDDGSLSCWMNRPGGASEEADAMRIDDANDWRSVSAGLTHTCALRNDRSLWCWGAAELCGIGMSEGTVGLTRVGTRSDWDLLVVERDHACATTTDGDVFCWGSASDRGPTGQIGVVLVPTIVLFD